MYVFMYVSVGLKLLAWIWDSASRVWISGSLFGGSLLSTGAFEANFRGQHCGSVPQRICFWILSFKRFCVLPRAPTLHCSKIELPQGRFWGSVLWHVLNYFLGFKSLEHHWAWMIRTRGGGGAPESLENHENHWKIIVCLWPPGVPCVPCVSAVILKTRKFLKPLFFQFRGGSKLSIFPSATQIQNFVFKLGP